MKRVRVLEKVSRKEPDTIEEAISVLGDQYSEPVLKINAKEYGISMSLVGVAEVQARRLQRISRVLESLEKNLFDPVKVVSLNPGQMLMLYKLASDNMRDSGKFLSDVGKFLNWGRLEDHAVTLQLIKTEMDKKKGDGEEVSDTVIERYASKLLMRMNQDINNEGDAAG